MQKRSSFTLLGVLLTAALPLTPLQAQTKVGFVDNEAQALVQAKSEKKLVLLDFTGSDWCGWCMKMDKEVFDTPAFHSYANQNLVLVELDYPHRKFIAPNTKKQNEELAQKFSVQSFPTLVILDGDGNVLKTLSGYQQGGPEKFIEQLKALKSS